LNTPEAEQALHVLEIVWNLFYWLAFVLCWFCLPFLSEYVITGEFTRKGRIIRSILNNLIFYGIAGVFFIVFLVYLYYKHTFEDITLRGFLIAMSNAWGLFLIIIFLGYGLVTVPKRCLKMTNIE